MPRRVRTTKNLAQRMDLQYFKQPHPFRSWRLWLSVLVPVAAVLWFAAQRASSAKVYSSGPLSASHAVLGKQCNVCHVTTLGIFRAKVKDDACLKCHDAPPHHPDNVTFTAPCSSCHVEHRGSLRLANTDNASCTQCHSDLRTRSGSPHYVRNIKDFDRSHPEFAALRPGGSDTGQIKLNHSAHLRPNLDSPAGPVQMDCQDCHRVRAAEGSWPYAGTASSREAKVRPMDDTMADSRHSRSVGYMLPVLYANQCAGCHVRDLQFDKRFDPAPHDKPEVVQAFLMQTYISYFAAHPGALLEPIATERLLPGKLKLPLPVPHTRQEWVDQQIMVADILLFEKGCKLCHMIEETSGSLPRVAKSSIPQRWFLHADFNHESHRLLTCTSCHEKTPDSRLTSDILLPGIASCRRCHQDSGPRHDAASARCSECHSYHDWSKEKPTKGKFTIPQLRAESSQK